ncbi:hypothetical protein ACIOKD_09210 [Streptomyces sp. NPDC087844]|uniref:hypothetical protein n=1 Tax=Streptomyces sp. NPDC087844 TaxID=3365805 RepID=UPI00380FBA1F
MGTLIILAILVLLVLGINSPVWWLAAAALIYLYVRHVRVDQSAPGSSPGGGSSSGSSSATRMDSDYHSYRRRRDRMARWERRYRRERPWNVKK